MGSFIDWVDATCEVMLSIVALLSMVFLVLMFVGIVGITGYMLYEVTRG